jgi:hypothetical protein
VSLTNYLGKAILKHVLGITAWPRTDAYLGVGTAGAVETDEDSWSGERSGNDYARQLIRFGAPPPSGSKTIFNITDVRFPEAEGNWGSINSYGIWTRRSGGKLLMFGTLSPITIGIGDVLRIAPGQIAVDGAHQSDYLLERLLNHIFRKDAAGTAFAAPSGHLALIKFGSTIPQSGSTSGFEPSGGNYARKPWAGSENWNDPVVAGDHLEATNKQVIAFNEASADWGTLSGCALTDAATGGNWLVMGSFVWGPQDISSGDEPRYGTQSSDHLSAWWASVIV